MNVAFTKHITNALMQIREEKLKQKVSIPIIDMNEGTIKYQFPLKKGMEHFPRKRKKLLFDSIFRANYELYASTLDIT
jgi:hypothetical protein